MIAYCLIISLLVSSVVERYGYMLFIGQSPLLLDSQSRPVCLSARTSPLFMRNTVDYFQYFIESRSGQKRIKMAEPFNVLYSF